MDVTAWHVVYDVCCKPYASTAACCASHQGGQGERDPAGGVAAVVQRLATDVPAQHKGNAAAMRQDWLGLDTPTGLAMQASA